MSSVHHQQCWENYRIFQTVYLPSLINKYKYNFVLMRDGVVKVIVSTFEDAYRIGHTLYPDFVFSIQEITDEVIVIYSAR